MIRVPSDLAQVFTRRLREETAGEALASVPTVSSFGPVDPPSANFVVRTVEGAVFGVRITQLHPAP